MYIYIYVYVYICMYVFDISILKPFNNVYCNNVGK